MGQVAPIDPVSLPLSWASGAGTAATVASSALTLGISAGISAAMFGIKKWREGVARRAASTQIVNEAEPFLQQNLQAYLASPRTESDQEAAAQNFYAVWNQVVAACRKVGGNAGAACIEDRQEGSTKWSWGNWFTAYLDPIRYDESVRPDSSPGMVYDEQTGEYVAPAGSVGIPGVGAIPTWVLPVAILGIGLVMSTGSGK